MRALLAVAVLAGVALSSSCLALYYFQNDPEHLPCDFTSDPNGACLKGYVCVIVEDGNPDTNDAHPECLKAAQKQKGDVCGRTEECSGGLVCATEYARCLANPDDLNCSLVNDADKHAACRTKCDQNTAAADCAADEFCFADGDVQFCQVGTCKEEGDCNRGANVAFCVGESVLGGKTGQCFEKCDPLACSGGLCPDCKGVDGQADADGGNPACDAGHTCNRIEQGANLGRCL